ncbi:MAG: DUF2892 domain-containing protein [Candidatus Aminicenantes bacterium]|nr:DUF2892 domain-containing protein [Candidatus Aminicenantes bacterium]
MKTNVGPLDRIIRLIIALGLAALILTGALKGTWAIVLGVLAVLLLITSAIGFCSLYTFFRGPNRKR